MIIWVDGDSCPRPVREVLCRAGDREKVAVRFVANRPIPLTLSDFVSQVQTSSEEGSADQYIKENSDSNDLIVTRDIPLAAELVELGRTVLNDRGKVYTRENVRERLAERNFNQMLREAGLGDEKSGNYGLKEIRAFSNAFDRTMRQMLLEENFRKSSGVSRN